MSGEEIKIDVGSMKRIFSNNYMVFFSILFLFSLVLTVIKVSGIQISFNLISTIFSYSSVKDLIILTITLGICSVLAHFKKFNLMFVVLVVWLLLTTVSMRTSNISGLKDVTTGNYTLGPDLDPFLYLRLAKEISNGGLQEPDLMRYAPLGAPNYAHQSLMPWAIFYVYKLMSVFGEKSITHAAIVAPVIFFIISTIGFLLFMLQISSFKFDKERSWIIAIIATLFYVTAPTMLHRTVAGIPEIESLGMMWFWFAFLFFTLAWKTNSRNKSLFYGALAGLFTGLMSWSWGGHAFIYMTFVLVSFIIFFFEKNEGKNLRIFSAWIIPAIIIEFLKVGSIISIVKNISDTGFALFAFYIFIIDFAIKKFGIREKIGLNRIDVPNTLKSFVVGTLFLILLLGIFDFNGLVGIFKQIIERLFYPFGRARIGLTVAENRPAYFTEILGSFGNLTWLFLFGIIILFYEAFRHFERTRGEKNIFLFLLSIFGITLFFIRKKITSVNYGSLATEIGKVDTMVIGIVILSLAVFLYAFLFRKKWLMLSSLFITSVLGFVFTRIAPQNTLNGETFISKIIFIGPAILFVIVVSWIYISAYRKKDERILNDFKSIDFSYIVIIILSFWIAISMRGAVRLLFIVAPVFAIVSAFVPVKIIEYSISAKEDLFKWVIWFVIIVTIVIMIGVFVNNSASINYETRGTVPSVYNFQWQNAMSWVRDKTPVDAVFVHWWDYGYWVQSIGERATVTDGGHAIGYWAHLTGRYLLTTPRPETALSLMKTYGVSYLLIDSTDIGKYSAFSKIGSDSLGEDRYSYLPSMVLDPKQTQETNKSERRFYSGVANVDQDIISNRNGTEIFLPSQSSYIVGFLIDVAKKGDTTSVFSSFAQPQGVFVYNQQQVILPLRYLYSNGQLFDFGSGIDAVVVIIPSASQAENSQGININEFGAAIYLSPKVSKSLFAQLYIMNDPQSKYPTVKPAHSEPDPLVAQMIQQGARVRDFLYYQGQVRGPIKIWKVDYPTNTITHNEFLSRNGDYAQFDNLQFTK